jgi:pullulanase
MLTIHYHRFDGNYDGLDLWVWDRTGQRTLTQQSHRPAGVDAFGPYFEIPTTIFGDHVGPAEIGFIVRPHGNWETRDGEDRFWPLGDQQHIWLIGNDPRIYTEEPDFSPCVECAWADGPHLITARLSHPTAVAKLVPRFFRLVNGRRGDLTVIGVKVLDARDGLANLVELQVGAELHADDVLTLSADGFCPHPVTARNILLDAERYFADVELGAICTPERTTFRVFAPTAPSVEVVLYDAPVGDAGRVAHPMARRDKGIWELVLEGDLHGRAYALRLHGEELIDIHSRCNTDYDGRGMIVDLRRTDPPDFRPIKRPPPLASPCDAVIWEVHVRDFTIHPSSGVEPEHRGLYLGAAQRGTHVPGQRARTGIDHLVELGVTHVQLLPVQDFENREHETYYNWGYMPVNFSSPEGWYATNKRNLSRVTELKQLVKAMHDAGLRVVIDVVYNHTAPSAAFEGLVPGYYHRRKPDGTYWNGSGCGNEFRSEAPMARKFIVDSCRYWAEEYGVDGFRFDLMGLIDPGTMLAVRRALDAIDPSILLYGEPWAATGPEGTGLGSITDKGRASAIGVGAFNDNFRNAIKGAPDGTDRGFIHDGRSRDAVKAGIMGAIHDWAREPWHAIQYVTCHDNLTLWDKNQLVFPDETPDELMRMQMLAIGILSVSQGVMFLHGGVEFCRTKFGHHNTYNAPDSINQLEWDRKITYDRVYQYTRGMIHLRRRHQIFRLGTRSAIEQRLAFHDDLCPDEQSIAFTLDGTGLDREPWRHAVVLINANRNHRQFGLPPGGWSVYTYSDSAADETMVQMRGRINVPGRSLIVMARAT